MVGRRVYQRARAERYGAKEKVTENSRHPGSRYQSRDETWDYRASQPPSTGRMIPCT
jgi:hypothetical protein